MVETAADISNSNHSTRLRAYDAFLRKFVQFVSLYPTKVVKVVFLAVRLSGELHEIRINMDRQSVYSISVLPSDPDAVEDSRGQIQAQLRDFILEFRLDNAFIYRLERSRHVL